MGATVEQVEIDGMFYCNHNDIQVDCKLSQWNKTKKVYLSRVPQWNKSKNHENY